MIPDHNHAWAYDAAHVLRCSCGAWIDRTETRRGTVRDQPTTTFCRLEVWTLDAGWTRLGADVTLLYPQRVPDRYAEHGKVARAVELGPDLQPTGKVWEPSTDTCEWCNQPTLSPHDGTCIL